MSELAQVETIPEDRYADASLRRFFGAFASLLAAPIALILLSVVFLWRSHELSSYRQIVAFQQERDAIYGPGTSVDYFDYKLELIEQRKPETVALGSSRALGFQGAYFKSGFVNAGVAMRSLDEGKLFVDEMLRVHKPKRIILTVDFWWFNAATTPSPLNPKGADRSAITTDKILLPYRLLSEGKLSVRQFLSVAFLNDRTNALTRYENTGVMGLISSNGNRADGSMLYGEFALGGRSDLDPRFASFFKLVDEGRGNFEHGVHPDPRRMRVFEEILATLRANGVAVYLVVPPVAPMVLAHMSEPPQRYAFIDELRAYLQTLPVPAFDFHDASAIPAGNCEFVDGYHSGDVTYVKMLLQMASSPRARELADVVKIEEAKRMIERFDGNVIDRSDAARFPDVPEKDFLLLGCTKR